MKTLFLLILGFLSVLKIYAQQPIKATLQNNTNIERTDEAIVIARKVLEKYTGKIPDDKSLQVKKSSGELLPSQVDDFNQDGNWDEVVFLLSFQPNEKVAVSFDYVGRNQMPLFTKRTQARMAKFNGEKFELVTNETMPKNHQPTDFSVTQMPLYQTEGVAWENDKVGFRMYFDPRNGKDIFGKTTEQMVLQDAGLPGSNYHQKSDWGMDILKVGASLGAGAIALVVKNTKGQDSLIRLGTKVEQTSYQLIADGPVRSIFKLTYKNWQVLPASVYQFTEQISITAGKYFYESNLSLAGPDEPSLAVGIVNLHNTKKALSFSDRNYHYLATHDKQSENQDMLGMSIVCKKADFIADGKTAQSGEEKILNTNYVKLNPKAGLSFRFYACWEATDKRFADSLYFENFLKTELTKSENPITINF
jgi:hypothetical protein